MAECNAMDSLDLLLRLGVALAIGLLTGIERSWNIRDKDSLLHASGIRSFALPAWPVACPALWVKALASP